MVWVALILGALGFAFGLWAFICNWMLGAAWYRWATEVLVPYVNSLPGGGPGITDPPPKPPAGGS